MSDQMPSCETAGHVWGPSGKCVFCSIDRPEERDDSVDSYCSECGGRNGEHKPYCKYYIPPAEALTNERKSTHGDWTEQARLAWNIKHMLATGKNWNKLDATQSEAIDMIAVKLSRILTGDSREPDHWDDIAGYAYLGKGGHKP